MKIKSTHCEVYLPWYHGTYTHQDVYCNILPQGEILIRSNTGEYKLVQRYEKSTLFAQKTFVKNQGQKKEGKSLK